MRTPPPPRSQTAALTVVELLVAMVVIAMLAILSASALRKGVHSSRDVQCVSNLRQIWMRTQIYANENRGSFPWAHVVDGYRFWPQDINKASGNSDMSCYICPEVNSADLYKPLRERTGGSAYVNYGINFYGISASTATREKYTPARITDLDEPSQVIAFIDNDHADQPYDGWYSAAQILTKQAWPMLSRRHGGKLNAIFCDGHVEKLDENRLLSDPSKEFPWAAFRYIKPSPLP
ncbi:MAG TPA: hypothetical protein VNQ90_21415 [Chthoniobacteraceae bacterium]|nr:hypothetical protein [Chthoniobacteraceae bacterium]